MNYKNKVISLTIFLMLGLNLRAQEMLGIINSNYAGIHGALINPGNLTTSKYYLDINFLTLGISAENNYLYLPRDNYKFSHFFQPNDFPTKMFLYGNQGTKPFNAFANTRWMGPSAMLNIGKHAFGITTSFRTVASASNIPYEVARYIYEGPDYKNNVKLGGQKFRAASLSWAELGLSYAYVFKHFEHEFWSGGITIKGLLGYSGAYGYADNADLSLADHNSLAIDHLYAGAGYSLPLDYGTNNYSGSPVFRGHGIGMDIGVTYQKMKKEHQNASYSSICAEQYQPYKYRFGLSIIDLGSISFKKNAQRLAFNNDSARFSNFSRINTSSVDSAVRDISWYFFKNPNVLPQGNLITVGLPTALSMQMDFNYTGNWYLGGMLIYPLILNKSGLVRPAQLAITPRYETDHFEVSLPVSMYDLQRPRIGISMRLGFLTVGTDKLGGFFHLSDFTGMDFYMAFKWSFLKGQCPQKHSRRDNSCGINEYKQFIRK